MSGFPLPVPRFHGTGTDGLPLVGGKLYSYAAGTFTPRQTYADQALTVPNDNPTILDAAGSAAIYIQDGIAYDFVLNNATDTETVWTAEDISVPQVAAPPAPSNVPTGGIQMFGGATAPTDYLLCDGTPVSRVTYLNLFNVIGTTFGPGNGSTTFNLPDLRQRFPMGVAASGTGNSLGAVGGTIDHTHTGPSHTHTVDAHSHTMAHTHSVPFSGWTDAVATPPVDGRLQAGGSGAGSEASVTQATANNVTGASSAANTGTQALTTNAAGTGATGTGNPPYVTLNFIIKT